MDDSPQVGRLLKEAEVAELLSPGWEQACPVSLSPMRWMGYLPSPLEQRLAPPSSGDPGEYLLPMAPTDVTTSGSPIQMQGPKPLSSSLYCSPRHTCRGLDGSYLGRRVCCMWLYHSAGSPFLNHCWMT